MNTIAFSCRFPRLVTLVVVCLVASVPAPAAVVVSTWNNSTSNWSVAANWSNVPASATYPNNNVTDQYNVTFGGGIATLTENITISQLTQSSGSISGNFNLTITGAAAFTFGDHRGTGTTILQGPTTISSSGFRLDGGRTLRNENTITWTAGQILFNNTFNGVSGGAGSGTINNIAGATFIASGSSATSIVASNFGGADTGADAVFNNAGTFQRSGTAGTTTVDVTFNNTGTVNVQTGILNLTNGGTHTGNFDVTAGAVLGFGGGTHNVNGGTVTSPGTVQVTNATVNLNTGYAIPGTTEVQSGSLNLLGGNVSTGTLIQSSGTITGTNNFTVTGPATLTFGDHRGTGTTILQGPTSISASGFRLDGGRILRNENTITWTAGQILFNNTFNGVSGGAGSGTINNIAGATFIASGSSATSIVASNFGGADTGADAVFNNAGTFQRSGTAGTTTVDVTFNNTGTVNVQTGILNLTNGGTHTGNFDVTAGAVLGFGGGTHNVNGGTVTSPGTVQVTNATVNLNTGYAIPGTTEVQSGSLNLLGGNASTGALIQSSGTITGTNNFTVTGPATLTFGDHRGTGTTILQGPTSISASGFRLDGGRILRNENTITWTAGQILFNNTFNGVSGGAGSGTINNIVGATFIASGDNAASIAASNFGGTDTGADARFNNFGTFRKSGSSAADVTTIDVDFSNTGTVDVQTGILNFNDPFQHVGTTLTGGTWIVRDGANLGLTPSGGQNITTNQGDVTLRGPGSVFARINTLVDNQGAFRILDNRNFTAVGAFTNSGVLQIGGGTFGAPALTNTSTGDINGFGAMTVRPTNNGVIRATGGTLAMSDGIASGGVAGSRVQVDAGATLNVSGGASGSRTHLLVNNGTLNVGTNTFVVDKDYTNAGFGNGNSFNPRANVTGAGPINAAGDVAQAVTGAAIQNGTSATPTLVIGNLRQGQNTNATFNVANTGTNGPDLRGALQTSVNGGNISDPRLSGTGVTAGNLGPIATGGSQSFQVNFTGTTAGPLTGQQVRILNNFDNVGDQTLNIVGATYQPAAANTLTSPVNLGNARVGGTLSTPLSITNVAPNTGGFTETLGASVTGTTGAATSSGGPISGLAAGATSNAISAGFNTATAGAKSGSATLAFSSTEVNGSGLGTIGIGSQTVNLSGSVYRLAAPTLGTINFGNVLVGSNPTGFLSVSNSASADGFSEGLNASLGTISGTSAGLLQSNGGVITNLAAGASNNNTLGLLLNTSNVGSVSANVQVLLASNGAGTSGLGVFDLPSQGVPVSGLIQANVGNLANASPATPNPVNLGNVRVGAAAPSQALTISNTIQVGEGLNASISTATTGLTATGAFNNLAPGATNNSSLVVGMNTATAGSRNGTATIALTSDGTFNSGIPTPLAPQVVNVTGGVYQPAAAGTLTTPVNLGTVRTGTVVNTSLNVTNTASGPAGFVETLGASFGTTSSGLVGNGNVSGLAAGGASNAMSVQFTAGAPGAFNGSAAVNFVSQEVGGSGLGNLSLAGQTVNFSANVNAIAALGISNQSPFTFTPTGANSALLDFGTIPSASLLNAPLVLSNTATGPSDSLVGSFNLAGLGGSPFGITGAGNFDLIGAGNLPVSVQFNPSAPGTFSASFVLAIASHNASQNDLGLGSYTVTVRGQVGDGSPPSSVPDSPVGLIGALTMLATLFLGHRYGRRQAGA